MRVWADTTASGGPGIGGGAHTIALGPGNLNLFLIENTDVYSSTGPVGSTPGTFGSSLRSVSGGSNEGSAFLSLGSTQILFVGSESLHKVYGANVTGSGGTVALPSLATTITRQGNTSATTGQQVRISNPEGVAVMDGSPIEDNGTPFFAISGSPIVTDANWSGKTLLVLNEGSPRTLVALPIDNDGTVDPLKGLALDSGVLSGNPDAVAVTVAGSYAYAHNENNPDFWRYDLKHVSSTGGSGHVQAFSFSALNWNYEGMVVLGNVLYAPVMETNGNVALYAMAIAPGTGNLGTPAFVTEINDGQGHIATGRTRLTTDGQNIYISDAATQLIFELFQPRSAVPALESGGLVLLALSLLALGAASIAGRPGKTTRRALGV